jgi:GH24 family phage-related lysozyme (muramidase)
MNLHPIIGPEIGAQYSGDRRYYDKFLQGPIWAGGDSGVTVGFGYDLGMNSVAQIRTDWEGMVNGNILAFFISCAGKTGQTAKKLITPEVKRFKVPYEVAERVFREKTLPRYTKLTMTTYPGLEKLNEDTQGVIVGLVYNRGASLKSKPGDPEERRREMAALVPAIADGDYGEIARQVESMKRLWVGKGLDGLVTRRENEARMIRESIA